MKGVNTAKNFLIIPNNLLQIFFKMSQKTNSKNSRSKWCLIDNEIADKITKISKTLQKKKKNSETATNEHNKEIPKERCISPEKRQKVIDDLG